MSILVDMADSDSESGEQLSKLEESLKLTNEGGECNIESKLNLALARIDKLTEKFEELEFLAERVLKLEQSFIKLNKLNKEGTYVNWRTSYHDILRHSSFVSTIDLEDMLWRMQIMSIDSNKDRNQMRKMLNSLKIHKVNRTTRFPIDEECVDIKIDCMKKCFEDIYYALSFKDSIDISDDLYDDKDIAKNATVYFKGAIDTFVKNLSNKDILESLDSFEKCYDLKWLPK